MDKEPVDIKRGPGRPRDRERTRAVLNAAAELLSQRPFEDITSVELARKAGVSTATLYRWWPNKEAILVDGFLASIDGQIRFTQEGSPLASLKTQIHSVVETLGGPQGRIMTSIIQYTQRSPEAHQAFLSRFLLPRRAIATEFIESAIQKNELKADIEPEALMDALYGAIYFRLLVGHAPLTHEFIDRHIQLVLESAQPQSPQSKD